MAQRTQVILEDDLDGGKADETISFSVGNSLYEIDLSSKNADKFRSALSQYIEAARKVGGGRSRARGGSAGGAQRDYDPKAVRVWAASNKVEIPARGRIPGDVLARFRAAGN